MNERFETLSKFKKNLYVHNSPVVVSAGALLKDKKTDKVLAQLKFQSISDKRIIALKIVLSAFDISGNHLREIDEYQYLDLNVHNGDFFGSDKAIVMPDAVTRLIKIERLTVVFDDGLCEFSGKDFTPLGNQEELYSELSPELVKQYQIDASTCGEYIPKNLGDIWLCSCQTPNTTSNCASCGAQKDRVFGAYNTDNLAENLQFRLARQKEAAELKRKQDEEAQAKEQAEKKTKKTRFTIIGVAILSVVIAIIAINALIDKVHYNQIISEIESYIETERYEQAFDIINNSELSYDDKEHYREKVIPYLQALHEETRNSSKSDLAFTLDETEYYISDDKIYSKTEDGDVTVLYETSSYKYSLNNRLSVYANNCLFFIEGYKSRDTQTYKTTYEYTAKYIDLETSEVEVLGRSDSRGDVVKLDSGCIFIGLNFLDFNEGIWYNPYNQSKYVGEDAVSDADLENAIYMN